jgi:hypothetical protein
MSEKRYLFLEVLIVVGVIAFLASAFFVLKDPRDNFRETRNNRRWTDISLILEAVLQYANSHEGNFPQGIDESPDTFQVLGTKNFGCGASCNGKNAEEACLNLKDSLGNYAKSIPYDPLSGSEEITRYYINRQVDGRLEVGACDAEAGAKIFVVR